MIDFNKIRKFQKYNNEIEKGEDIFTKLTNDELNHYVVLLAFHKQENFKESIYHKIQKDIDNFPREWKEKICRNYYLIEKELCCDMAIRQGIREYLSKNTVMFTGPRPKKLVGYITDNYRQFVDDMSAYICQLYDRGYRRFITGGAQGFDQLVFWAVHKAKVMHSDIQNVCYIPYKGYSNNWMKSGLFGQDEFALMLQLADEVHYICKEQSVSSFFKRNEAMCDDASACVALYPDDTWRTVTKGSGTASCMQYAAKTEMKMCRIQYAINGSLQFLGVHQIQ